jgi:hypothetical protein
LLAGSVRPHFVPQLLTMDQWVQLVISYLKGYFLPSMSREDITHPRQSAARLRYHRDRAGPSTVLGCAVPQPSENKWETYEPRRRHKRERDLESLRICKRVPSFQLNCFRPRPYDTDRSDVSFDLSTVMCYYGRKTQLTSAC